MEGTVHKQKRCGGSQPFGLNYWNKFITCCAWTGCAYKVFLYFSVSLCSNVLLLTRVYYSWRVGRRNEVEDRNNENNSTFKWKTTSISQLVVSLWPQRRSNLKERHYQRKLNRVGLVKALCCGMTVTLFPAALSGPTKRSSLFFCIAFFIFPFCLFKPFLF